MASAFGCDWLLQIAAAGAFELWWNCLKSALDFPQIRVFFASLRAFVAFPPHFVAGRPIGIAALQRLNS
jgi:hypothetical protein